MKMKLIKTATILTGLLVMSACSGKKDDNKIAPVVGPQGRITGFGTNNTSCDFTNGVINCTHIDSVTGVTCNTTPRNYSNTDINSLCQEVRNIHNESLQAGATCNVSAATNRILSEYCGGVGNNPNIPGQPICVPGLPCLPAPQPARFLNCNVSANGGMAIPVSLLAGSGSSSFTLYLTETKTKTIWKIINVYYPTSIGEIKLNYQPGNSRSAETITVVGKMKDAATGRRIMVKHSGAANARFEMNALMNGNSLDVTCNTAATGNFAISESANLVCTGSSHVVGSQKYEENIQFIRPINSIVSGEELFVSEALRVSLNKSTGMLTTKSVVDTELGPDLTSTSSLRADSVSEAFEGNGKSKLTCKIK